LVLGIYEKDVRGFTEKILNNLSYMISQGIIEEYRDSSGKGLYGLIKVQKKIEDIF